MAAAWGVPLVICVGLAAGPTKDTRATQQEQCWYKYGESQFWSAAAVVISMFVVCVWALIRLHRFRQQQRVVGNNTEQLQDVPAAAGRMDRAASASELVVDNPVAKTAASEDDGDGDSASNQKVDLDAATTKSGNSYPSHTFEEEHGGGEGDGADENGEKDDGSSEQAAVSARRNSSSLGATGVKANWGGHVNYNSRMEGIVMWNVLSSWFVRSSGS